MAVVVLEVAAQRAAERVVGLEGRAVQELRLERVEERLHVGVLAGAVARGTLLHAQLAQSIAEERSRVLAAPIAVEDESGTDPATANGGIEHGARELGVATPGERPGEDAPRVLIHHHGEKPPPARDRDVGDVADPDAVGPLHGEAADAVRVLVKEVMHARIRVINARGPGAESRQTHEAHDAPPTDRDAVRAEGAHEPGTAVHAGVRVKRARDDREELPVLLRVRAGPASGPRVVAGAGDAVERTESGQGERFALRVDERERFPLGSEQNRIAFFRSACSVCSRACSRSSAWRR